MRGISVVAVVLTVVCAFVVLVSYYGYHRDIGGVLYRAQVAADRDDMLQYLRTLADNMEEHGMASGHFALFWKTPDNDLELHYKTVQRAIDRLEGIEGAPKNGAAYQTALDDIRGVLRELVDPEWWMIWVWWWWLIFLTIAVDFWAAVTSDI